jgi:hypothetical protein
MAEERRISISTGRYALYDDIEIDVETARSSPSAVLATDSRTREINQEGNQTCIPVPSKSGESEASVGDAFLSFDDQMRNDLGLLINSGSSAGIVVPPIEATKRMNVTSILREFQLEQKQVQLQKQDQLQKLACEEKKKRPKVKSRFLLSWPKTQRYRSKKIANSSSSHPKRRLSMEWSKEGQALFKAHTENMQAFEQLHHSGDRRADKWATPVAHSIHPPPRTEARQ